LILVDTSIWIELLAGRIRGIEEARLLRFVTCGPILQEVTQGLRPGAASDAFLDSLLAVPVISDPMPVRVYLAAAEIFRRGRRRGFTIRASADCLIAAVAIENHVPIWHRDRDFAAISRFTELEVLS
jgi:predicted nucleic acid-binding protein